MVITKSTDNSLCNPNNDFIRANQIFVSVADSLILCFGGNHFTTPQERVQHWSMLKVIEQAWKEQSPPLLSPIYYRERDPSSGMFSPEVWYTNACQVAGAQHVELGRIRLAVSDPTRTSRLRVGAIS
jgi:hypothetical protein